MVDSLLTNRLLHVKNTENRSEIAAMQVAYQINDDKIVM